MMRYAPGVVKRRATAFTPMPMRIATPSVTSGIARPVLRNASPAAELFAQCLKSAPSESCEPHATRRRRSLSVGVYVAIVW